MQLSIKRADLARAVTAVGRAVEARNTVPVLSMLRLSADGDCLTLRGTDLDVEVTASAAASVHSAGETCVNAKLMADIAKKAGNDDVSLTLEGGQLVVKSGRSRFSLSTLPASDFPDLRAGAYNATFDIDLAGLFAPVQFAISTEQTRYFLNGIFLHNLDGRAVAVATDGHRLARHIGPSAPTFPGIIVPTKTVGLMPKGVGRISISESRIRIEADNFSLVSKVIDGTFPDYQRVIPANNTKIVGVDRDNFLKAADRVITVASDKSRAVRLSISNSTIAFSARSEVGEATDEIATSYEGEALDVGYNSQYLKDMLGVLPSGDVVFTLADAGSPALVTGGLAEWTGVLMPVRV